MVSGLSLAAQRRRFAVAVPTALALATIVGILLLPGLPREVRQAASGAGLLLAGAVTAVSCRLRAAQTSDRRRRSWLLLVAAAVLAVAGNVWVTVVGADPVESPSAVGDACIGLALLLSILALLNFPSARRRGIDLLVMSLDGLIMGAAVLITASVLVYPELLDAPSADVGSRFASLLFPLLDVVLATVALLLVVRSRGADRPALALVAAGFVMYAVADLAFAVLVAQERFEFGTPLDLGWIAGYVLIGLAAWYPSAESDALPDHVPGESEARNTMVVFAVLLVAASVQILFGDADRLQAAQALLWLVLVCAVGVRQTMLSRDNATLRRGLERRVREQTADLRRLARQNEVLLTSVGDGIYGVDGEGRVTFVNPSGAELLGCAPADLLGRKAHDEFHAPTPEGLPYPWEGCYVTDAIRHGLVTSSEADVYVRLDGDTFPVEITASPILDGDVVRGAVVVFRDVTQRREVDRMKNEFLSVVSHELRTPLTSIRGSLGLLAGGTLGELSPRGQSMATIALESTERLTRLINDILDLERIESGTRPLELAPTDAAELVRAATTELEGFARASGVRLEVGAAPGRMLADRDRVVQTLTNLLGNAIKFSGEGSVVRVDAVEQDGEVLFRVHDRGRGIPADQLETIFERFVQVDSSDARQQGGTGLGLAISRGIVERHGGRIWAESDPGDGTTLLFTLPKTRGPADGDGAGVPDAPLLLVCDDDPATVETFSAMLRAHGYRTRGVTDGAEALRRVVAEQPAALLLDLAMPGTTGAEVLAELRADDVTRQIPVVVVSGLSPDTDPGLAADTDGWLIKPVTEERLAAAVATALHDRPTSRSVLLVEDDVELAGVIATLLGGHGLQVRHATSAADALALGHQAHPDVIVLDLHLPDGDGSEVVAGFRRTRPLAHTPLVVYSAADVDRSRRAELALGETVFLTKGREGPEAVEKRVLELVNVIAGRLSGDDLG
jgi:PAS domain S-box-containing protein